MRYLPTLLLAYLALGVQSAVSPFIAANGVSPNLMLPVIVFISLYAQRDSALLAAYILGLMQDMLSQNPLGFHALVYASVALVARSTQPALHREHVLTHIILAIMGVGTHGLLLYLLGLRMPPRIPISVLVDFAIYTAILTPLIVRLLIWGKRMLVRPMAERK